MRERVSDIDTSISKNQELHIPITQNTGMNLIHRNAPHITNVTTPGKSGVSTPVNIIMTNSANERTTHVEKLRILKELVSNQL